MLQSIPPPPKILFFEQGLSEEGGGEEVYIIVLKPLDLTKLHISFIFFMLLNLLVLLWKEEGGDHGILYSFLLGSFNSLDH